MRFIWNLLKKVVYAIDDAICWCFSFGYRKRKERDHIGERFGSRTKHEIFRHHFIRRG